MRLAVFFVINLAAAAAFGWMAYAQGHGAGAILLRVIVVLGVLQLAYAAWLVAVSVMTRDKASEDGAKATQPVETQGP
ncbi:MAG: hypothetical protein AAGA71_07525 [Pseudomonadota bacterium]